MLPQERFISNLDARLKERRESCPMVQVVAIEKFKKKLRCNENEKWFDCDGVGLLFYAAGSNRVEKNVVGTVS